MPATPLERFYALVLIILLAFVCLFLVGLAQATTRYVSTLGNDSNSCATSQAPGNKAKRTLNGTGGAIQCMVGGDTLLADDGTWGEQISDYDDREHPGAKRPPSGLSWNQPTTIKAINPGKVTINKPQAGDPYNHVVMLARPDSRYIKIEGLVIDSRGHGACVWVGPSSYIEVQGNVLKNCGGNAVYGAVADDGSGGAYLRILNNEITNFATEQSGPPGAHAIYFTGNNSVISGNYIHAPCPYYGIHATSELGGLHTNVIENNRVVGCDQAGIITQGANTIVRNNLLENNCIGIYLSANATKVLNNTIYGFHKAPNCGDAYGIFNKSGGSTVMNNLILQQGAGWSYIYAHETTHSAVTNLCDASGDNACQLQATASAVVIDGPGGNLKLVAQGPAVNTGTTTADVPTDRVGVARPQGSRYDIGAYEYTTQAPPTEPPPTQPPPSGSPTVTLTSPTAGAQVSGTVPLIAAPSEAIAGLQFKIGGQNLGPEITQPPWSWDWNTAGTAPGPQTLSVSVRNAASVFGHSAPVSVTVLEGSTPPAGATQLSCIGLQSEGGGIALACAPHPARR